MNSKMINNDTKRRRGIIKSQNCLNEVVDITTKAKSKARGRKKEQDVMIEILEDEVQITKKSRKSLSADARI